MKAIAEAGAAPRLRTARPPSRRRPPITFTGLRVAAVNELSLVVACVALLNTYLWVRWGFANGVMAFDFDGTLWEPGLAIRDGLAPYPEPVKAAVEIGNPALYPPLLMLLVSPLTVLPWAVGAALWTIVLGVAVAGALYALDVRDLRCYAIAFVSFVVVLGLVFGNATLLLVPLVALAWRWREDRRRSGICIGLAIAAKLFLWPLLFWLLGTRRYRAFGVAVVVATAAVFVPWAVIGFSGMSSYPDLMRVAEEVYAVHSYSVATMLSAFGVDAELGSRSTLALGLGLAAIAFYAGRRRADSVSISLAVLAAVLGSPIVWPFYYALLLVPLAIARPRFSALWLLPTLFYFAHRLPRERLTGADVDVGGVACCRPDDVPMAPWVMAHAPAALWPAVGQALVALALIGVAVWSLRRTADELPR
jgi:glycosyl transferase family 87